MQWVLNCVGIRRTAECPVKGGRLWVYIVDWGCTESTAYPKTGTQNVLCGLLLYLCVVIGRIHGGELVVHVDNSGVKYEDVVDQY